MSYTTGSLINSILPDGPATDPEVGQGATSCLWTDRHAGTIVEVIRFKTGERAGQVKAVVWQRDKATRTDTRGMSDAQDYTYEPNPGARRETYTRDKHGRWLSRGGSTRLSIGRRDEHYDYSS